MKNRYVVGLAFDSIRDRIVLIRKARPEWQAGLLNGVGGHIEAGEKPIHTMIREFEEETGVKTFAQNWDMFCSLEVFDKDVEVYFFRCFGDGINKVSTQTDERVGIYVIKSALHPDCLIIDNLKWIIPLALTGQSIEVRMENL